jgi:hypothetical protein
MKKIKQLNLQRFLVKFPIGNKLLLLINFLIPVILISCTIKNDKSNFSSEVISKLFTELSNSKSVKYQINTEVIYDKIVKLSIKGDCKVFPKSINLFSNLETLVFSGSNLQKIDTFPMLSNLKYLTLTDTYLEKIPDVSKLQSLLELDMSTNGKFIDTINLNLNEHIEFINLANTSIKYLRINNGKSVSKLDLDESKIEIVDSSIYSLPNLTSLSVFNNYLSYIEISKFKKLKYLRFNPSKIRLNYEYLHNHSIEFDTINIALYK